MRNMMLLSLIVLSLAYNCTATAPMQLGGDSGKTALAQVASLDATDQTTNASQGDLWTWGEKNSGELRTGRVGRTIRTTMDRGG